MKDKSVPQSYISRLHFHGYAQKQGYFRKVFPHFASPPARLLRLLQAMFPHHLISLIRAFVWPAWKFLHLKFTCVRARSVSCNLEEISHPLFFSGTFVAFHEWHGPNVRTKTAKTKRTLFILLIWLSYSTQKWKYTASQWMLSVIHWRTTFCCMVAPCCNNLVNEVTHNPQPETTIAAGWTVNCTLGLISWP